MPRIRTVKPTFFRHRELYDLEVASGLPVRLAFEALWTVADREGRFRWRPEELKLDCLPYDPVNFGDVLATLAEGGFIRGYTIDGKPYGVIPTFHAHQLIGNREAQSTLPDPDTGEPWTPRTRGMLKHAQALHEHTRQEREREGEREQEREGEQEGNGKGNGGSSEALSRSEPAAAPGRPVGRTALTVVSTPGPAVLSFPTVGAGASLWHLGADTVADFQRAYPSLDIVGECQRARSWLQANPTRKKTARGMQRFLNAWLARSNDQRGPAAAVDGPQKSKLTRALEKASQW